MPTGRGGHSRSLEDCLHCRIGTAGRPERQGHHYRRRVSGQEEFVTRSIERSGPVYPTADIFINSRDHFYLGYQLHSYWYRSFPKSKGGDSDYESRANDTGLGRLVVLN